MKSKFVAFLLWLFFGWAGFHRFYVGKIFTGIIWMFSFGLLGIGWFIDLFLIGGMVDTYNALYMSRMCNNRNMNNNQNVNNITVTLAHPAYAESAATLAQPNDACANV